MYAMLSPEVRPAKLLAPGLMVAVICSAVLALLRGAAALQGGGSQNVGFADPATLVLFGIFGAFGGFLAILSYSLVVWIYGRALSVGAGFVKTLAVTALALGVATMLQLAFTGAEFLITGQAPALSLTNLARYLGSNFMGLDLTGLVTIGILYVGCRRYLGYGALSAGILAFLTLAVNIFAGMLA